MGGRLFGTAIPVARSGPQSMLMEAAATFGDYWRAQGLFLWWPSCEVAVCLVILGLYHCRFGVV